MELTQNQITSRAKFAADEAAKAQIMGMCNPMSEEEFNCNILPIIREKFGKNSRGRLTDEARKACGLGARVIPVQVIHVDGKGWCYTNGKINSALSRAECIAKGLQPGVYND